MKKLNFILLSFVFIIVGCQDDFLVTEPTQQISAEQIAEASKLNPGLQAANMSGVYSYMYNTGTGGTTLQEDFGQRGIDIYTDMLSSDMAMPRLIYGWYRGILQMTSTKDYTSLRNYSPWRYYYRIINGANTVIDGLGGTDAAPTSDDAKHFMGQAKAMRAYGYFYLSNLFSTEYNPSEMSLPIYTNTTDPNQPLSSTEDVYNLMIKDLTESITLLEDFNRSAKNEVNKEVAQGLLAYVYLTMGKNSESAELSQSIIDSNKYKLMDKDEVVGGFNDISTSGWMWGVDLTVDIGLDLVSWWGMVDIYTFSYAGFQDTKVLDRGLFDKIPDTDIRKTQFLDNADNVFDMAPYKKFYDPGRKVNGQRNITTDYFYMRIAEMYLLNAEANARAGNEDAAKTILKKLLEERIPDSSYVDALSGQDLLDEIYLQIRIEHWGEGKSYLAMKRNKATVTRGSNHLYFPGDSFNYNDEGLTFEIPQSEILNNPNISQ